LACARSAVAQEIEFDFLEGLICACGKASSP
jgi:hypothetical protein